MRSREEGGEMRGKQKGEEILCSGMQKGTLGTISTVP